jgi:hypothetical protein
MNDVCEYLSAVQHLPPPHTQPQEHDAQVHRARICKPLNEPRNRFPACWNRLMSHLRVYKFGLASVSPVRLISFKLVRIFTSF